LIVGFPGVFFFVFFGLGFILSLSLPFIGLAVAPSGSSVADVEDKRDMPNTQLLSGDIQLGNPAIDGFEDYVVSVRDAEGLLVCEVTFNSLPQTADIAEAVVRSAIEELVKNDDGKEVLAMAFDSLGEQMPDLYYGGDLNYKPSDGQVLSMDERNGITITEANIDPYFIRMELGKTPDRFTPARQWYTVAILFSEQPSDDEVRLAVSNEVAKLKSHGLDINPLATSAAGRYYHAAMIFQHSVEETH
jgi:hypothetical protein